MRIIAAVFIASALLAAPVAAQEPPRLVNGNDWQRSSMEQRRAYLIGVSNTISVGARYDTRQGQADTFALHAQKGLADALLEPAVAAIDDWYKAHPDQLDKPVLSVIWREVAKRQPLG
ncbi:MAG TPA: hypothetical protein VFV70_07475 [Hyphomonadaceae bacterium]|nr:hypothetical protein [Hyphomonadaceae bacterium]